MLCGWEDTRRLHSKLYSAVCHQYENRIHGMKHFICAWITGLGNQKTSNVTDHAILSTVIAYTVGRLFIEGYKFRQWKVWGNHFCESTLVASLQSAIHVMIEFSLIFSETNFMKVPKIHEIHEKICSPQKGALW